MICCVCMPGPIWSSPSTHRPSHLPSLNGLFAALATVLASSHQRTFDAAIGGRSLGPMLTTLKVRASAN